MAATDATLAGGTTPLDGFRGRRLLTDADGEVDRRTPAAHDRQPRCPVRWTSPLDSGREPTPDGVGPLRCGPASGWQPIARAGSLPTARSGPGAASACIARFPRIHEIRRCSLWIRCGQA